MSSTSCMSFGRSEGRYRIGKNKSLYGAINGGGADIELRTFNGEIVVRRGP